MKKAAEAKKLAEGGEIEPETAPTEAEVDADEGASEEELKAEESEG